MDAQGEWHDWLTSSECRPALAAAAEFIFRQALRLALPGDLLPCPDPWRLPPREKDDCLQALADDLWIFLRTRPATWYRRNHWTALAARSGRVLILRIGQEFLNNLKDKARTSVQDPARALYRRLRQILQEETEVAYRATVKGAFFGFDDAEQAPCSGWEICGADYGDWESPLLRVGVQDLEKRSSLLTLSRLFWGEACQRLGKKGLLPIRELVRFIACHYPGFASVTFIPFEAGDEGGAGNASRIPHREVSSSGEISYVRLHLATLARQLAATWSPRQREAFALIQGQELPLAGAAARMGYQSAAGAAYAYHSALDVLRDFCLLWPGLSPPDLDQRLFEAFVEQLVQACDPDGRSRPEK